MSRNRNHTVLPQSFFGFQMHRLFSNRQHGSELAAEVFDRYITAYASGTCDSVSQRHDMAAAEALALLQSNNVPAGSPRSFSIITMMKQVKELLISDYVACKLAYFDSTRLTYTVRDDILGKHADDAGFLSRLYTLTA